MTTTTLASPIRTKGIFALNIFVSAFLIFFIQPVCAKQLLPFYGGSAFVWISSVLFFQLALFLGYLYAYLLAKLLRPKAQVIIHFTLLLITFYFIPLELTPSVEANTWGPIQVFSILSLSLILPLSLVCSSSPLMQHWYCLITQSEYPYGYYAISNAGSLIGLFCYPLILEIILPLDLQFTIWSLLYTLFALASLVAMWGVWRAHGQCPEKENHQPVHMWHLFCWLVLTFVSSTLLLSSTYYVTQNLINMPLIWVVPLALYLISFIITFAKDKSYDRLFWLQLFSVWLILFSSLSLRDTNTHIDTILVLFALMYSGMMVCHGELINLKPAPSHLALFYLMIALGGMVGGIFVNFVAVTWFNEWWDLYLPLMFISLLSLYLLIQNIRNHQSKWHYLSFAVGLLSFVFYIHILNSYVFAINPLDTQELYKHRNTYGLIRVVQEKQAKSEYDFNVLTHGSIIHGVQFLANDKRMAPTTYYGPTSGVHAAFEFLHKKGPLKVAAIGMGTGTIATYTQNEDNLTFYDIDPDIVKVADQYFEYIKQAKGHIEIQVGDGRLKLQDALNHEQRYDLIVVDAFSGDSIPFHLMTLEAMQLYEQLLSENGIIAFHITNTFINLAHVTNGLANQLGYEHLFLTNRGYEDKIVFRSDWVLVTKDKSMKPWIQAQDYRLVKNTRFRNIIWTDAHNSLLPVIRLEAG